MKRLIILSIVLMSYLASAQQEAVGDIISITKNPEGKFDVVCADNTQEVVTEGDIMVQNLCPYIAFDPNRMDILFVVDDSGSMTPHQNKLALHAGLFIEQLKILGVDYQIAVTTTTVNTKSTKYVDLSGYEVLTKDLSDLKTAFEQNVSVGAMGDGWEKGFVQTMNALTNYKNSGFARPNALLHVIYFGDEGDQSEYSAQQMDDFLYKTTLSTPEQKKYKVSAINIFSQECKDKIFSGGEPGTKEAELVQLTGGVAIDICDKIYSGLF